MSEFGQELKRRRAKADMSLRDVAQRTGISNPMIFKYESGECTNISLKNAQKLSRLFFWRLSAMARTLGKEKSA